MRFIYDAKTGKPYLPLLHLAPEQARICVYNSLLSEAAVLGFDYGYSLDYPKMLCLWEAQFGDFANGAQTIIDQFIVSAESKWQRPSGIVLAVTARLRGPGPEHSSARLERFLQACAEDNIQVCNLTTPAQYFHVLRRQMKRDFIKPLIIMTPKSLLRSEQAASRSEDFTRGWFAEIIAATAVGAAGKIKRIVFCSGKVYYDLVNYRAAQKITEAAIIRIEQLYPLAEGTLREVVGLFQTRKVRLVPGGIAEHGCMDLHRTPLARAFRTRDRLCGPQCQREPRRRRVRHSQARAGSAHRRSVQFVKGKAPLNLAVMSGAFFESSNKL